MKINTKKMTLVALFTSLTAVGAFISIPVGPVPITMQTLFVLLAGIILGSKLGALSQIVYITLGLIGIPIFAGFSGGLQTILKPSFGFLIGFIVAAYVIGMIVKTSSQITIHNSQLKDKTNLKLLNIKKTLIGTIVGTLVIYIIGLPYMYFILNYVMNMGLTFLEVVKMGLLLFIPGDIVKIIIATFVGVRILPIMKNIY